MKNFDDIRPYRDNEVPAVLKRLAKNDLLISTVRTMKWPNCPDPLQGIAEFLISMMLAGKMRKIKTVHEFQKRIVGDLLLAWVVSHTTDSITSSGLDDLSVDKPYIFVSNHRDIVLDSAFLNYVVHERGYRVPYIAFGDNLLINDLVSDLIRINKAFIVKRNLPPRKQLKALIHLSEYISQIRKEGNNIWIAQREGRAKDGIDTTNPAIIKMFHLSQRKKKTSFSDFIKSCNIVPVAISYEKDPCDRLKGWELHKKSKKAEYKKRKREDYLSMSAGITGDKGRVHLTFGKPLHGEYQNEKEVATAIDRAIHEEYRFWPCNYVAYDKTFDTDKYRDQYTADEKDSFISKYNNLNPTVREIVLKAYANPVSSREALNIES